MAIVQDAANRCLGLITLEDIMEELVGDIQDEFDRLPRHVHSLSGGTWMFGGGVPVGEVVAKLGGSPVSVAGTLAAWLERQLGQPPKPGQTIRHDGLEFVVRRVRRGRIFEASASMKSQAG